MDNYCVTLVSHILIYLSKLRYAHLRKPCTCLIYLIFNKVVENGQLLRYARLAYPRITLLFVQ